MAEVVKGQVFDCGIFASLHHVFCDGVVTYAEHLSFTAIGFLVDLDQTRDILFDVSIEGFIKGCTFGLRAGNEDPAIHLAFDLPRPRLCVGLSFKSFVLVRVPLATYASLPLEIASFLTRPPKTGPP